MNHAYFVQHPRTVEDLQKPHLLSAERAYELVGEVWLAAIDYENFITDMYADRQFMGDSAGLCAESEPMKCLLVHQRGKAGGVLVVPDGAYVKWAAILPER